MNNGNAPRIVPANAYTSQNTTPGLKVDAGAPPPSELTAENQRTEKAASRLKGVPKPNPAEHEVTPEEVKAAWEAYKADGPTLGENHW